VPTDSSELFETVWWALQDIKAQLEDGDHSNKALFNPINRPEPFSRIEEKPVQTELIKELNRNAHQRYVAVAEEEIGGSNYPDIRVHSPAIEGATTIEVKIAERWSYTALLTSINEQIVGRYLRDAKSTYGILAIASSGPKKGWILPNGAPIPTFADLLKQLQSDAAEIGARATMKNVRVVGIDFH
jgi:hypothetical protein